VIRSCDGCVSFFPRQGLCALEVPRDGAAAYRLDQAAGDLTNATRAAVPAAEIE
jgi:hypothetical protein